MIGEWDIQNPKSELQILYQQSIKQSLLSPCDCLIYQTLGCPKVHWFMQAKGGGANLAFGIWQDAQPFTHSDHLNPL